MKIAIIGAGAMGGAFANGLLSCGKVAAKDVFVANPHEEKLEPFARKGANTTTDNRAAASTADAVVIAVKPWLAEEVVREVATVFNPERQILLNFAASVTIADVQKWLSCPDALVYQVMPNIAIAERESMTFIAPSRASAPQTAAVVELFDALGKTMLTDEAHLYVGTALAGCGIAFAMRYIRAASEGGVELGYKAEVSKEVVLQTLKGAVALLEATGEHPEEAIDKVTTPGGLTIKGLNEMEHAGFSSAVIRGLKACVNK